MRDFIDEHFSEWSTAELVLCCVGIVAFVGSLFVRQVFSNQQHAYNTEYNQLVTEQRVWTKKLSDKQAKVNYEANEIAAKSADSDLAKNGIHYLSMGHLTTDGTTLFETILTYGSGKEYMGRRRKLGNLISVNIANDQSFFSKTDDDGTGHSYIDTMGLESSFNSATITASPFDDATKINGYAQVTSTAHNQSNHDGQVNAVYSFTYNANTRQFTKLSLVGFDSLKAE